MDFSLVSSPNNLTILIVQRMLIEPFNRTIKAAEVVIFESRCNTSEHTFHSHLITTLLAG
jgi:hypothetical protein